LIVKTKPALKISRRADVQKPLNVMARLIQRVTLFSRHPSKTEIDINILSRNVPTTFTRVSDALDIRLHIR